MSGAPGTQLRGLVVSVPHGLVAGLLVAVGALAGEPGGPLTVLWGEGQADRADWTEPYALEAAGRDGLLVLQVRERDARLARRGLDLRPSLADAVVIRYRASGFAVERTSGELFYENGRHGFSGENYVHLPSLLPDGQWHEMVVAVARSMRGPATDWSEGGPITAVRLDITNEAPGTVEIGAILVGPGLRAVAATDVDCAAPAWFLVGTDSFTPGPDGHRERRLVLPPGPYGVWARVFAPGPGLDLLGGLVADGLRRDPVPVVSGTPGYRWLRLGRCDGGEVRLRLPQTPSVLFDALLLAAGDAEPRERPPAVPVSVVSTIRPLDAAAPPILRPYWQGQMICCPGQFNAAANSSQYVRRRVEVPADLTDAWLQLAADDLFRLSVNGRPVAENTVRSSWTVPTVLDVTAHLRPGAVNAIAVEVINQGGPTGVLVDLVLNRADHGVWRVVSDGEWRGASTAAEGWTEPGFDDSGWAAVETHPPPPNPPWSAELAFVDHAWQMPSRGRLSGAPAAVRAGDELALSLDVVSERPVAPGEVVWVRVVREDSGGTVLQHEALVTPAMLTPAAGGGVRVACPVLRLSRWTAATAVRAEAGLYGRRWDDPTTGAASFRVEGAAAPAPLVSRVTMAGSIPTLEVDGQVVYPMVGNGEGRHKAGVRQAYRRAGFNIQAVWIDPLGAEPWWCGPGEYRFDPVDAAFAEQLDGAPEAWVLPIVWAAPPPWWQEANPDEAALFSDGQSWPYYKSTPSFASSAWRRDAAAALTAFVEHVEAMPYGSRVLGYWVIGGVSAEWQGWGSHASHEAGHLMDYSRPAQAAFARFLQDAGLAAAAAPQAGDASVIPTLAERLGREIGAFRDPAVAGRSIEYLRFYSESLADTLLTCTRAAKNACGRRKVVGVYFGYSLEYANMAWCLQMAGHNALRRVLDSPDVDFLSAPPSYSVRAPGQAIGWMWPFRSIQTAGKLVWVDDDTRTFLSGVCDYTPAVNFEQTQAVLRRNFGTALCRLCPQGFLAINSGREIDDPRLARDLRILRRAGEYTLRSRVQRRAEIAAVVDEDSVRYLALDGSRQPSGDVDRVVAWNGNTTWQERRVNPLMGDLLGYQRDRLARLGAPVDYILASDLARPGQDYKLVILLDCFQYDEAWLRAVRERLYARRCVVLWCYAPGFIRDGTARAANMEALTGLRLDMVPGPASPRVSLVDLAGPLCGTDVRETAFGVDYPLAPLFHVVDGQAQALGVYRQNGLVALAAKRVGEAQSVFCGSNKLSVELLRGLARAAGVFTYTEACDPFDANDAFVMLHATRGGPKIIRFPAAADVVDVFTGTPLAEHAAGVTLEMEAETTRLLFVGDSRGYLRFMDMPALERDPVP